MTFEEYKTKTPEELSDMLHSEEDYRKLEEYAYRNSRNTIRLVVNNESM